MGLWVPSPSYTTTVPSCLSRPSVPPPSSTEVLRFGLPVPFVFYPGNPIRALRGGASLSSLPVGISAAMAGDRLHPEAETAALSLCLMIPAQLVPMFCLSRPRSCVLKQWPTRPSLALAPRPALADGREHTYRFPCLVRRKTRTELLLRTKAACSFTEAGGEPDPSSTVGRAESQG